MFKNDKELICANCMKPIPVINGKNPYHDNYNYCPYCGHKFVSEDDSIDILCDIGELLVKTGDIEAFINVYVLVEAIIDVI